MRWVLGFALAVLSGSAIAQPMMQRLKPDAQYKPMEAIAGVATPTDPKPVGSGKVDYAAAVGLAQKMDSFALLIWQGGQLRLEQYWDGASRASRPEPMSMHKTVMALAVGQAIAQGKIKSVDDPLSAHIPEWANDARGKITLRQVLQMSSGLDRLSSAGGMASPASRWSMGEGLMTTLLDMKLGTAPGSQFVYQNPSSQLACLVLERATGQPYTQFMSQALWQPMGAGEALSWVDKPGGAARCYAHLMARPIDWLRVGLLLKDRGKIGGKQVVAANWVDEMTKPAPANPSYGLQMWLSQPFLADRFYNVMREGMAVKSASPSKANDLVFLDGFGGQRVYVSRSRDLVIVRLGQVQLGWDDYALPNLVVDALDAAGVKPARAKR
jgi:CubicO group peptidase (beta-lactamase class C family)